MIHCLVSGLFRQLRASLKAVSYTHLDVYKRQAGDIDELKAAIKRDIHDLIPKHITKEDIMASINYNMHLELSLIHISQKMLRLLS